MNLEMLPALLGLAWLLPLASFSLIVLVGPRMGKAGIAAGHVATGAILGSLVLSLVALTIWLGAHGFAPAGSHGGGHGAHAAATAQSDVTLTSYKADEAHAGPAQHGQQQTHGDSHGEHHVTPPAYLADRWYTLGEFGKLRLEIGYYIDALTVFMFVMVSLIASCIHFYATGYMHDELHDVTDKEVRLANGKILHRPGRYHRFFQYLSLFCFSMFGIVIAGNIAMVFVFWELVGICSYFLIGYYYERKSASNAANKAFIVNRVGDFGMIIGLACLFGALGTFTFGDSHTVDEAGKKHVQPGLFSLIRPADHHYALTVPDGMVKAAAYEEIQKDGTKIVAAKLPEWRKNHYGYGLLIVAGLGIFCGCVGKSAQFPLHVWLPDAMEGPTPVSALVHSATMVAAGVYLVGRFYPVFAPEVLLTIAYIGAITLFIAATIAITATDIKRVLAYSTVSQLGYMMLALGLGGWLAGVFHLITHAFFKSLLFMCSGSVIHACHTNEMPKMGGLRHKMPFTAYTMLIGCMAIAGAGVPFVFGFSGYYSKDAIITQAMAFQAANPLHGLLFYAPVAGAATTAFYMFRLWYLTFAGKPRDQGIYDHAHESPPVMYVPLVVLSVFAIGVAWSFPFLAAAGVVALLILAQTWPKASHALAGHGHDDHGHGHDTHGHGAAGHSAHDTHAHAPAAHDSHGHDTHGHESHGSHGHESHGHDAHLPTVNWITVGLVAAVAFAAATLVPLHDFTLTNLLEQARPARADDVGVLLSLAIPNEHAGHAFHTSSTVVAFSAALLGFVLATLFYGVGTLNAEDARRHFSPIHQFLVDKWRFDELYDLIFIRPTHLVSGVISSIDKQWIDKLLDNLAAGVVYISTLDDFIDRTFIDGTVNRFAEFTWGSGLALRQVQTGKIRQYVVFIAVGAVALMVLVSLFRGYPGAW